MDEEEFSLSNSQVLRDRLREDAAEGVNCTYGNNMSRLCITLDVDDEEALCDLFNSMKGQTSVESLRINGSHDESAGSLWPKAALTLASAISSHHMVKQLSLIGFDHIHGFSSIALAIQTCKTPMSLSLVSCGLTREQMEYLDWLLAENALEELVVSGCFPANLNLHFPSGLATNQSLRELHLICRDGEEWFVSRETLQAIPNFLRVNRNIQHLSLDDFAIPSSIMGRIIDATAGHESLTHVAFRSIDTDWDHVPWANSGIKTLEFSHCSLGESGIVALSEGLKENSCLEKLVMHGFRFGSRGMAAIATLIEHHTALKEVDIEAAYNPETTEIARALARSTTIKDFRLEDMDAVGFESFSSYLPDMVSIESLTLHQVRGLSKRSTALFLKALERNTELKHCLLTGRRLNDSRRIRKIMPSIQYQIALNRGGKRILKSERHVPAGLWPLILARSSKDPNVLYFFLREKPDVLINKPPARPSRKRKRGWLSGWFG